jgi:hypothetical protein
MLLGSVLVWKWHAGRFTIAKLLERGGCAVASKQALHTKSCQWENIQFAQRNQLLVWWGTDKRR